MLVPGCGVLSWAEMEGTYIDKKERKEKKRDQKQNQKKLHETFPMGQLAQSLGLALGCVQDTDSFIQQQQLHPRSQDLQLRYTNIQSLVLFFLTLTEKPSPAPARHEIPPILIFKTNCIDIHSLVKPLTINDAHAFWFLM